MQLQYGDCKKEEIGNETMIDMLDCEVTKRKCDVVRKVEKTKGELEERGENERRGLSVNGKDLSIDPFLPSYLFYLHCYSLNFIVR